MHKYRIFKVLSPVVNILKQGKFKMVNRTGQVKNEELEPPPDDRRTHLLWAGNIDRRVGDSLLYGRWAPFAYPVGSIKLVSNSAGISDNRKNSYLNKLVSNFKLFSWLGLWMLYSDDAF